MTKEETSFPDREEQTEKPRDNSNKEEDIGELDQGRSRSLMTCGLGDDIKGFLFLIPGQIGVIIERI